MTSDVDFLRSNRALGPDCNPARSAGSQRVWLAVSEPSSWLSPDGFLVATNPCFSMILSSIACLNSLWLLAFLATRDQLRFKLGFRAVLFRRRRRSSRPRKPESATAATGRGIRPAKPVRASFHGPIASISGSGSPAADVRFRTIHGVLFILTKNLGPGPVVRGRRRGHGPHDERRVQLAAGQTTFSDDSSPASVRRRPPIGHSGEVGDPRRSRAFGTTLIDSTPAASASDFSASNAFTAFSSSSPRISL